MEVSFVHQLTDSERRYGYGDPYFLSNWCAVIVCNDLEKSNALSFYVTKTVLVDPKWFWSDQIDLDLTIMI